MKKSKKKFIIISLSCVLFIMGVVYASVLTSLNIKSSGNITGVWDVRMTKVEVYEKSAGAEATAYEISNDGLSLDLSADLAFPGDYVKYQITIRNKGTIKTTVTSITDSLVSGSDTIKLEYDLTEGTNIRPNSGITFTATIKYSEDSEILGYNSETKHKLSIVVSQNTDSNYVTSNSNINVVSGDKTDLQMGDEIAIGDEHFYVLSQDDDSVTMLAKYNLLVGNIYNSDLELISTFTEEDEGYGLQSENAKGKIEGASEYVGTVAFSAKSYWVDSSKNLLPTYGDDYSVWVYDNNADIKTYVDNYREELNRLYGLFLEEEDARLIKWEELKSLGCDFDTRACSSSQSWVYNTTYWTGSAYDKAGIWFIVSNGRISGSWNVRDNQMGVRPVITISKTEL